MELLNTMKTITNFLFLFALIGLSIISPNTSTAEPGDSHEEAIRLEINTETTGEINGSIFDSDHYVIELDADSKYTIEVSTETSTDFDFSLSDENDDLIEMAITPFDKEVLTFTAQYDGDYFINVFAFEGAGSFTIIVGPSKSENDEGFLNAQTIFLTFLSMLFLISGRRKYTK